MTKSQFMIDKDKILKVLNYKHPKCGYNRKELIEKLYKKVSSIKHEMNENNGNDQIIIINLLTNDVIKEIISYDNNYKYNCSYYTINYDDYQKKLKRKKIIKKLLSS